MHKTEYPSHRQPLVWAYALLTFTFLIMLGTLNHANAQSQWTTSDNNINNINNTNTGNVGIGTTAPGINGIAKTLTIQNSADRGMLELATSQPDGAAINGQVGFFNTSQTGAGGKQMAAILSNTTDSTALNRGGNLTFHTKGEGGSLTQRMVINSAGNVGIGLIVPATKLDVGGQINASGGLCIAGDCKASWAQVAGGSTQWMTSGSNIFYNTGSVGIGTASPAAKLDVNGSAIFSGSTTVAGRGTFFLDNSNVLNLSVWSNGFFKINAPSMVLSGAFETFDNYFGMRQTSNNSLTVRIPASGSAYFNQGNVGIGTTNPTAKLDVNGDTNVTGNINATGTINAKYQDVAEWVQAGDDMPAGTVVVLNSQISNQVIASSQSYDTRVAGVVSARPGIALGEAGPNKVLVATTGRVRVKVDATRAPIRIGDLLVTSDVAGVAMKSEPLAIGGRQFHAPGTLIGKALEPLEKGVGEILVLLSLQ